MKKNFIDTILKVILILVAILIMYWFFQLLFGGSPTLSQFNFALIVMIAGILLKVYREIGEMKVEAKYNFKEIKTSFIKIKEDIDLVKKRLKIG